MLLLYSSEDDLLASYVRDNWAALDTLSGEHCDIYTSVLQHEGGEDVYSIFDDLKKIPGGQFVRLDKLPVVLLWSDRASLCISLTELSNDKATLRSVMRGVFQCLQDINCGITIDDKPAFTAILETAALRTGVGKSAYTFSIDRRTIVTTNKYRADRGSVIVATGATARDVTVNNMAEFDLAKLSGELAQLRAAMKLANAGSDAALDVAIGQVAVAESAVQSGDELGTLAALKLAGTRGLKVAQEIGVTVAAAATGAAIHLGGS